MKAEFVVDASQTVYLAVLPLPVGSPRHLRNAEPRCSAAVSARSDLTAKQKLKKGSMTVRDAAFLQWKLERGTVNARLVMVILHSDCQLAEPDIKVVYSLFSLCYYVFWFGCGGRISSELDGSM